MLTFLLCKIYIFKILPILLQRCLNISYWGGRFLEKPMYWPFDPVSQSLFSLFFLRFSHRLVYSIKNIYYCLYGTRSLHVSSQIVFASLIVPAAWIRRTRSHSFPTISYQTINQATLPSLSLQFVNEMADCPRVHSTALSCDLLPHKGPLFMQPHFTW